MGTHWELDENTLRTGNKPKNSKPNQEWMHCKHNILGKNTGTIFLPGKPAYTWVLFIPNILHKASARML
jgi:hypothetical protein